MNNSLAKLKKDKKFHWTDHIIGKMRFYQLSPARIKRIIRFPQRIEQGIAENTIACMQVNKSKKKREEIWVMYQRKIKNNKLILITAWRYPGKSPERNPIPQEIVEEIKEMI